MVSHDEHNQSYGTRTTRLRGAGPLLERFFCLEQIGLDPILDGNDLPLGGFSKVKNFSLGGFFELKCEKFGERVSEFI